MAIEYLYDAIRATAGQEINICACLEEEDGTIVTSSCGLMLHDDEKMIYKADGVLGDGEWLFTIPAEVTKGLKGRYWYCMCRNNSNICFKHPIYLK